jgi:hypothetical protein
MMMLEDLPKVFFDWSRASTMALDELPDSDLRDQPEYQITQEWLDETLKCLNEEKRVAGEREVDNSAEIGVGMEMR